LLEAASCGRAIVATDVPGCREIVRHNENGLLVPPRDPRALANALKILINDPELRRKMGLVAGKLLKLNMHSERIPRCLRRGLASEYHAFYLTYGDTPQLAAGYFQFSEEIVVKQTMEVYKRILTQRR